MEQMREQAARVGTRIIDDLVVSVDLSKRPFQLVLARISHKSQVHRGSE
jgi:thioredoxin reductase